MTHNRCVFFFRRRIVYNYSSKQCSCDFVRLLWRRGPGGERFLHVATGRAREKGRGGQMKEVPSTGGKTLWGGMFMDAA